MWCLIGITSIAIITCLIIYGYEYYLNQNNLTSNTIIPDPDWIQNLRSLILKKTRVSK